MAIRQLVQTTPQPTPAQGTANPVAARHLAAGLTLVPYWGIANGRRIPCCAWVKLRPGESISNAARRLSGQAGLGGQRVTK